jgi:hypothetical protein
MNKQLRSVKTDFIFYLVISISLTLLFYLVYNSLDRISNSRHIIKVFSTLALPVPIAVLAVFITAGKPPQKREYTTRDVIFCMLIFIGLIFLTDFILVQYNHFSRVPFESKKLTPVFINTVLTYLYINNYLRAKNIYTSAILSGILMGLAVFIFLT